MIAFYYMSLSSMIEQFEVDNGRVLLSMHTIINLMPGLSTGLTATGAAIQDVMADEHVKHGTGSTVLCWLAASSRHQAGPLDASRVRRKACSDSGM